MQFLEMAKKEGLDGRSYAAAIITAPKTEAEYLNEWKHIGEALVQWTEHRRSDAKMVMLTVISDPAIHAKVKEINAKIYADEKTLAPLLKSLEVRVTLLDKRSQPLEEYQLGT